MNTYCWYFFRTMPSMVKKGKYNENQMFLLGWKRIFCLTKSFSFHFALNQLQLWRGEEAAAGRSRRVERGGGSSRNPEAAGAAAGVSRADGQRVCYPEESRLAGRIQWHDRLCPAYEGRNPGKGGHGVYWSRGSKGKCWMQAAARLRAKRRRKEQCWNQKPLFPLKRLQEMFL